MRRKGPPRLATGAKLLVTRTSGAPLAYSSVVLLDFAYSGQEGRIDVNGESMFSGGARTPANWISLLFFMRVVCQDEIKRRGSRNNLQGRGSWRGTGRAQFGQIIRDSGRLFRSVKTGRRTYYGKYYTNTEIMRSRARIGRALVQNVMAGPTGWRERMAYRRSLMRSSNTPICDSRSAAFP